MRSSAFKPLAIALGALLPVMLVAGIWLGAHPDYLPGFLRSTVAGGSQTATVERVIDLVHDDYYRKIPDSRLVDSSAGGIVASLKDQFSSYYDPQAYKELKQAASGRFTGIGVTVIEDPLGLRIVHVYAGSPAARAGLHSGDRIVAVGGRSLRGRSSAHAIALIKGRPGTAVTLTIQPAHGARRDVRVERSEIEVPQVSSRIVRFRGVPYGYVQLSSFNEGAHAELRSAIDRVLARGAKGIVLDLRGNGGGLVEQAVLVASNFVPKGTIVTMRSRAHGTKTLAAAGGAISSKIPVVVLMDRGTASAAEIVAGALQDHHRAQLIGTRTFGKGVFQELTELPNGGALQITVGQYFTPSGHNLGAGGVRPGAGLHPNIKVSTAPTAKSDPALDAGLASLASQRATQSGSSAARDR